MKWFIVLMIIMFSGLLKVFGIGTRTAGILCGIFALLTMVYVHSRYNKRRHYYQAARHAFVMSVLVIIITVIEITYTKYKYSFYSLYDWSRSLLYCLLYVCLSPAIVYMLERKAISLKRLINIIILCTVMSYLIRMFIQFYWTMTGRIIFEDIAYENATTGWIRNGKDQDTGCG